MKRKRTKPLPFDIERFKEMIRPLENLQEPKQQPKQPNQAKETK